MEHPENIKHLLQKDGLSLTHVEQIELANYIHENNLHLTSNGEGFIRNDEPTKKSFWGGRRAGFN